MQGESEVHFSAEDAALDVQTPVQAPAGSAICLWQHRYCSITARVAAACMTACAAACMTACAAACLEFGEN